MSYPSDPGGTSALGWPDPLEASSIDLRSLEDLQGNILAGFNKSFQTLLFVRLPETNRAQTWLSATRPHLANNREVTGFNDRFSQARRKAHSDPDEMFAVWCNLSLTASGLRVFAAAAMDELAARTDLDPSVKAWIDGANHPTLTDAIGDTVAGQSSANDPEHWLFGGGVQVDGVLLVAADRAADRDVELARQRKLLATHDVTIVFEQDGAVLPGLAAGHEHFGFKDGISQPGVIGYDKPDPEHPEQVQGKLGTDLIAPGTFVLGYKRDDGTAVPVPRWMFNGSFLVTRRLAQDVPGFWTGVERQHEAISGSAEIDAIPSPDALAAKLVGRWRSGTPTDHAPLADRRAGQDPKHDNAFDFGDDLDGVRTPKCAHIRKVYPRDGAQPQISEEGTKPHRIIRRGIPFGPPFQPTAGRGAGADAERGLLFQCYQASLTDGFVFIQQAWVNEVAFSSPGTGRDAVIGLQTAVQIPVTGVATAPQLSFDQFVHTQGSLFSITLSLSTIDMLAAGDNLPFS